MTDFEKMFLEFRKKWISNKTDRDNKVEICAYCCCAQESDIINNTDLLEKEIGSLEKDFWMLSKSRTY
jgi:hypothetical protein